MTRLRILAAPGIAGREQNPYVWLLYSHMRSADIIDFEYRTALRGRYHIVHYHWPESILNHSASTAGAWARVLRQLLVMEIVRARGARAFWTVHNLRSHEHLFPRLEKLFWWLFTRRVDAVIALSESGRRAAIERFPALARKPQFVIPHGTYRESYPPPSADARARLRIPESTRVALLLGQIRRYKNASALIRTFRARSEGDWMLMIAGSPHHPALAEELRAETGGDPRVRLDLRYLTESEVSDYLSAADLAVLPYQEILNSGSALLALSFHRPVLVPELGAMRELADEAGPNWVRTHKGPLTVEILDAAFCWAEERIRTEAPRLENREWDALSQATCNAYRNLRAERIDVEQGPAVRVKLRRETIGAAAENSRKLPSGTE
jgi:beta-1,4-mannosyltransferase